MKFDLKKNLPHIIAVLAILLVNVIYFIPQFQGKKMDMGDITAYRGASEEANSYRAETGEEALWTNSMFGGMPAYNISTKHQNNVTQHISKGLNLYIGRPAGIFIMGMLSLYLCLIVMGVNSWVSLIMAIIFGLSTSNLMLMSAGHVTKVRSIMTSAPIIAGVLLTMKGRYWLGGSIFTVFLGISVMANHPQMIYYLGLTLSLYMIFALVDAVQKGAISQYAKAVGILVACSIIAVGASATKLMPTYEYGQETMRGNPILTAVDSAPKTSSSVKGLDYDYAMGWSGGTLDILSVFIPYAAGGGTVEELSKDSKFAKVTGQRKSVSAPTYFGTLPSTAGPYYFGAIVFFLFFLGALIVPGKFKWWLVTGTIFTLLLSMGKNFDILNKTMFDYFPLFNKFRTPNSVLSITGVLLVILAGIGFNEILKREDKTTLIKPLLIAMGVVAGFSVLFGLIGPSMISFESAYDARMGSDKRILQALYEDRAGLLTSSAFRTAGFVLMAGLMIYGYLKGKIGHLIMIGVVGLLAVADQTLISKNYFGDNYVSERKYENQFVKRPADLQVLADKDPHYRVQDFTVDTYNTANTSYFHKTVGGYHAAKLQRIQDVIDRHLNNRSQQNPYGNQAVLNMLNTKYFIIPTGEKSTAAQQNPGALGNAWFVNNIKTVPNANSEIDALSGLDPSLTAIVHEEFKGYISGLSPNKQGTINLTKYTPNTLEYTSNTTSDQLAVFSEVWYGPNLGWQAYIDDQPVEHIRANYLLRALKVPAGQHVIKFEFKPSTYNTGKIVSLISSILLLVVIGFAGYKIFKGEESVLEEY
ncbi:MAG: hypothetical protein ACJA1A_001971 [Saprospiraceae bacterium]|jgi:hypothetical protein